MKYVICRCIILNIKDEILNMTNLIWRDFNLKLFPLKILEIFNTSPFNASNYVYKLKYITLRYLSRLEETRVRPVARSCCSWLELCTGGCLRPSDSGLCWGTPPPPLPALMMRGTLRAVFRASEMQSLPHFFPLGSPVESDLKRLHQNINK